MKKLTFKKLFLLLIALLLVLAACGGGEEPTDAPEPTEAGQSEDGDEADTGDPDATPTRRDTEGAGKPQSFLQPPPSLTPEPGEEGDEDTGDAEDEGDEGEEGEEAEETLELPGTLPEDALSTVFFSEESEIEDEIELGDENVLGLSEETKGVLATYEDDVTLLVVVYPDADAASAALEALEEGDIETSAAATNENVVGLAFGEGGEALVNQALDLE